MGPRRVISAIVSLVLLAIAASPAGASAARSQVEAPAGEVLGSVEGTILERPSSEHTAEAADINDEGQIVGSIGIRGEPRRAVLWQEGQLTYLDALADDDAWSEARAINEAGQIVGWSANADGYDRAVLWQEGRVIDLGILPRHDKPGRATSGAVDINEHGVVLGWSEYDDTLSSDDPDRRTVIWKDGQMTELPEHFVGEAIDDSGRVIGFTSDRSLTATEWSGDLELAAIWDDGAVTLLPGFDSDAGEEVWSRALAVNDDGTIVGFRSSGGPVPEGGGLGGHAVVWAGGPMTELPTLPEEDVPTWSYANDIGDSGLILGRAGSAVFETVGVVWVDAGLVKLVAPDHPDGCGDCFPTAINDAGQVVGYLAGSRGRIAVMWDVSDLIDAA